MPILTWMSHHRLWALGMSVTVLVAAALVGVWFFILRSPATPVDLRQALRLYRQSVRAGGARTNRLLPAPGVYRYLTTGGEQLSIGGVSRSFPTSTTMIVTVGTCATVWWEPLEEHLEGLVECSLPGGGLAMPKAMTYEDIAGTQTTTVITCPASTPFLPPRPTPHEQWHATCHESGHPVALSGQELATVSVTVNGTRLPAYHLRLDFTFTGNQHGSNPTDYWVSQDGLIVREHETVDVTQQAGSLGDLRYTEQMAITLASTTPLQ